MAATADWEINDILSLKSITAWRNIEAGEANDVLGVEIPFQTRTNYGRTIAEPRNTDWYSEELQLNGSAFDEKVDYVWVCLLPRKKPTRVTLWALAGPSSTHLNPPNFGSYLGQGDRTEDGQHILRRIQPGGLEHHRYMATEPWAALYLGAARIAENHV